MDNNTETIDTYFDLTYKITSDRIIKFITKRDITEEQRVEVKEAEIREPVVAEKNEK